jgi:DNA-directed RNA polymerase subunit RPC12/RpoP
MDGRRRGGRIGIAVRQRPAAYSQKFMTSPASTPPSLPPKQRQFPCTQCGADLVFAPGTDSLQCPYCGTANTIPASGEQVQEQDYLSELAQLSVDQPTVEVLAVHCDVCGAESTLKPNVTATKCPFCGSGIVATGASKKLIKPQSLLPFRITLSDANERFSNWIRGLWFLPTKLKKHTDAAGLDGMYLPCWTYDCITDTQYTGQRGDYYWVTETYTTRINGRNVTQTRQVRKIRWSPVSGLVTEPFDDLMVMASNSLPRKQLDRLEPWDLDQLCPYEDEYLSGFVCQSYEINLQDGFESAQQMMQPVIAQAVRQDIGGDEQRIDSMNTQYHDIRYKHLLLPVWISAYRFQNKVYRFLVNARTGEVQGERPISWI